MKTCPTYLLAFAALSKTIAASPLLVKRASDTTTVALDQCSGTPQHYSQGVLYGTNNTTPPESYLSDIGVNYLSAGGAQIDAQPAGYSTDMASYERRFAQLVDAYQRMQEVKGITIAKMADLFGADERTSDSFVWPGDNDDWTKWDAFVQQVISDLKANGMTEPYEVQIEPWNEPDINFGGRPQSQYNEMWVRTAKAVRAEFGSSSGHLLPLVGPSTAGNPGYENGFWDSFLSYLQSNGGTSVQPDVWNWHMEGGEPNDPIPPAQALPAYVERYGLTTGLGLQNNEFGVRSQQVPGWSAWFKARYERLAFHALRGNWASGNLLLDNLADLLIRNADGSHSTTGEYQVYLYYKQMNGAPCSTTTGSSIDSYAVGATDDVTALVGSQSFNGTWTVAFDSVSTYFGSASSVKADIIHLPYNEGGVVNGWTTQSTQTVSVSDNVASVSIDVADGNDAYAVHLYV